MLLTSKKVCELFVIHAILWWCAMLRTPTHSVTVPSTNSIFNVTELFSRYLLSCSHFLNSFGSRGNLKNLHFSVSLLCLQSAVKQLTIVAMNHVFLVTMRSCFGTVSLNGRIVF